MGYMELIFDSGAAFRSSTIYNPTDTPLFTLGPGIKKIVAAKVLEVIIPISWYNFVPQATSTSNPYKDYNGIKRFQPHGHQVDRLTFYNPQTFTNSIDIVLPTGAGTAKEFVDYMNNTYLVGASFTTFQAYFAAMVPFKTLTAMSLTFVESTQTIQWSITAGGSPWITGFPEFGVLFTGTGQYNGFPFASLSLGFPDLETKFTPQVTGSVLTWESDFTNANPFNYVVLNSKAIGSLFPVQQNYNAVVNNVYGYAVQDSSTPVAVIPLTENYKSIMTWQDPNPDSKFTDINMLFQNLDFYLTLGPWNNEPLNLNGQSFQVKMAVIVEDENDSYDSVNGLKRSRR